MKSKQTILIPKGSEKAPLRKYVQSAIAAQKRRFEEKYKLLQEEAKLMRPQFPFSDKEKKDINRAYRRHFPTHSRKKPPPFKPLIGHNPSVYVPFDFSSSFVNNSGIGPYGNGVVLNGPNPQTGQIGAYMSNSGDPWNLFSTDILAAHSSVGFLYFAQASGTLHVSAQAIYCGQAVSVNANVYAGLELSCNHFISANQH